MNKEFSNIIVFCDKDIIFIKEKIKKILEDLGYKLFNIENYNIRIDIIQDNISKVIIISSDYFKFDNLAKDKSVIRKISKRLASDTMMVTSKKDISIIEKYSFNKRTYDYMCFGNREKLILLGYNEAYEKYMYREIWKNNFVGRNSIEDLDNILSQLNTFFENYEIILEILKLYGIKKEFATYNPNDKLSFDVQKEILYFK